MKIAVMKMAAVGILLAAALGWLGCSRSSEPQQYWCPMHPEVVSTDPNAQCKKCGGMKLLPKPAGKTLEPAKSQPQTTGAAARTGKYHCPMHPQVVAERKGSCPICGMDLVPVAGRKAGSSGAVVITPEMRQLMGLTLGTVEKRALIREIRAAARIVVQEPRLYHVNVKVDGWVEELFVATTGQFVRKGEPLLRIYSPSLMSAQAEHLSAPAELRTVARRRLELLDMSDEQIAQLEQTKQINKTLTIHAPATGYVIERNIAAGHRLAAGELVMMLADLSELWADAEVFQADAALLKPGDTMEIAIGNETFTGRVSFISPVMDQATRTVKVRADVPNPALKLKPEMWGTARLKIDLGEKLAIPCTAVMRSGERTYAFKSGEAAHLIPVEVKLGARAGDWFEVLDGLAAGDRVVTSANFLVDSESQLKAALSAMTPAPAAGETETAGGAGHRH
ncbi:MAG: efflux RND transporter periplasmic adaptor subunit [Verrucomicrobiae bacterium]|nr:efflux RND transporter periplasmic adaptor subunit [Verrucomicrobiae bacterium]